MYQTLRKILAVFFLLCLFLAAWVGFKAWQGLSYTNTQAITVRISKGTPLKKIATQLKKAGATNNSYVFEGFVRILRRGKTLRAGEYEIKAESKLTEIVDQMIAGRVKLYKLTIPEGFNIKDICNLLVKNNLSTADECSRQTVRVELLKDAPPAKTLEGYLFPETYLYEYDVTPSSLVEQTAAQFYKQVDSTRIQKAKKLGLMLHEVVVLASVVEKETGKADERALIAGVFQNRLKIGMPLQSDPTVIYGIKDFNGNLTKQDLETDSPYNTYTRAGLPAGPICNPGLASIDAVLNPAQTDYLYFVAKGDGSHYFSRTPEEHNRAVEEYQLK